jgi:hypothetical protein
MAIAVLRRDQDRMSPRPLLPADVLALQRTLGNATVNRLLRTADTKSSPQQSGPPMLIQRMGLDEFYGWFKKARSLDGVDQRHAFLLHALGWAEFASFQNWLQVANLVHEMWGQAPRAQQQQQASSQSGEGMELDTNQNGSVLPAQPGAMPAQTGLASQQQGYPQQQTGFPQQMGFQQQQTGFPQQMGFQQQQTGFPQQMGFQQQQTGFHQQQGYPQQQTGFPQQQGYPQQQTGFPQQMGFQQQQGYPQQQVGFPQQQVGFPQQMGYPPQYTGFPFFQPPQPQVTAPQQQQAFFDLFLGETLPDEKWRSFKTRDRKYTVNVAWHHILNHTYRYMYTTDGKISHSLFPPRTTAADMERYIREAIEQYPNGNPELSCGTVTVGWNAKDNVDSIVTFFPSLQDGDPDKLDRDQLESLMEHYGFK